ncbi:uncharacterized protein BDW43DRAFT_273900 [Aspergillus alliaceus]|uniref:uncharacterized protein n=1 Tax=Petromyces alliaceus TaxID=209559 RepID=UPI0012A42E79|nr:uncharacterized protein BDW43DRAFT_273900 [Aspergillus alliaceus]KAB8234349.1 hypothetical protein BDW43DRAFT_273900 [Aspergillus alliaceus]
MRFWTTTIVTLLFTGIAGATGIGPCYNHADPDHDIGNYCYCQGNGVSLTSLTLYITIPEKLKLTDLFFIYQVSVTSRANITHATPLGLLSLVGVHDNDRKWVSHGKGGMSCKGRLYFTTVPP